MCNLPSQMYLVHEAMHVVYKAQLAWYCKTESSQAMAGYSNGLCVLNHRALKILITCMKIEFGKSYKSCNVSAEVSIRVIFTHRKSEISEF